MIATLRRRRAASPRPGPARVLIVSASMGAGHDGAARTLAEQLRERGHPVEVRDFLRSGPLRIGSVLRRGYEFELKHVPGAYDATYRFWYKVPWLCPLVAWLVTALTRRRVMRWVRGLGADVAVSTYPLATLCMGRLRRTGRLAVPAVNFITDFGVHPLWVHPGVDLNLAIHDTPAREALRRTGRHTVCCGPAVSGRFDPEKLPPRAEARARFGISGTDRAVLIVAGSWGVGNVTATWEQVADDGRFLPVVVCGRDERLRRHLEALALSRGRPSLILGWTDAMPSLMAACDALIENAGGLTSLEAMSAGLPVVSFDPIAGHGKENTSAMHAAGVARLASDGPGLVEALDRLTRPGPEREEQVARARSMFREVPAETVLDRAPAAFRPLSAARRIRTRATRIAVAGLATGGLGWAGLTTGVAMATEAGAGVAQPAANAGQVAFIGVRLTSAELHDPVVDAQMRALGATLVVDDVTARAATPEIRALAAAGVSVDNGGAGDPSNGTHDSDGTPWNRATLDARAGAQISSLVGIPVTQSVPGRRLDAWDLLAARDTHTELVVPDHILHPGDTVEPIHLQARQIYLVNGVGADPAQMEDFLASLRASLSVSGLEVASLAALE